MKHTFFLVVLFLLVLTHVARAQPVTLPLYQGEPPLTKSTVGEDQTVEGGRITKVALPQVIVYQPADSIANHTAVLICPGGGYGRVVIQHEGYDVADWYSKRGYVAVVLKYRLPDEELVNESWRVPLMDAEQGIRVIRQHAREWKVDPERVGVVGFSAGGHLAASVSVHGKRGTQEEPGSRPDFSILVYPVISMDTTITHEGSRKNLLGEKLDTEWEKFHSNEMQVNADTPPAFMVHAWDDNAVPIQNSLRYGEALHRYGIPVEMHLFQKGGHGFGLGSVERTGNAYRWAELSDLWIQQLLTKE